MSESKNKLSIQTKKVYTSRIAPSEPSTSRPQKPTLSRSESSLYNSAGLDKSTGREHLILPRVEIQQARNRPHIKGSSSSEETEMGQEPPPILRKRKSVLLSSNSPPSAYPSSTIQSLKVQVDWLERPEMEKEPGFLE